LLKEANDSHDYANPNISFNVSGEKAGASVKLTTDGAGAHSATADAGLTVRMTSQTIWFKPIDVLKITAGKFDVALNKETITYGRSVTGLGGNGFLVSLDASGFGLDVGFTANNAFWLTKNETGDPAIKQFFFKAAYSADFGTIGGYLEFNRDKDGYFKDMGNDMAGAIKSMHFGAGYKNTFGSITMFLNVAGFMNQKFEWIRPEFFISGSADALSYAAFVAPQIYLNSDLNKKVELDVVAKVSYKLDPCTVFAQFKDENILADKFVSTIEVGATGNLGAMGWILKAQIDTGKGDNKDKVNFSVPFELTFAF
jgi:hypothetical protein